MLKLGHTHKLSPGGRLSKEHPVYVRTLIRETFILIIINLIQLYPENDRSDVIQYIFTGASNNTLYNDLMTSVGIIDRRPLINYYLDKLGIELNGGCTFHSCSNMWKIISTNNKKYKFNQLVELYRNYKEETYKALNNIIYDIFRQFDTHFNGSLYIFLEVFFNKEPFRGNITLLPIITNEITTQFTDYIPIGIKNRKDHINAHPNSMTTAIV